jgi:hypothetical protein
MKAAGNISGVIGKPRGLSAEPAKSQSSATTRLTPRQRAKALGAMRQRTFEQPGSGLTSIPKGTIAATPKGRGLSKVDAALKSVKTGQGQMAVANIFMGGGMTANISGVQARRAVLRSAGKVQGAYARSIYSDGGYNQSYKAQQRQVAKAARMAHSPKSRK